MIITQAFKNELKAHEGFANHFYRDTEGYVTIGYGHQLAAVANAKTLRMLIVPLSGGIPAAASAPAWNHRAIAGSLTIAPALRTPAPVLGKIRPATAAEIESDWAAVLAQPFGKRYGSKYYKQFTNTIYPREDCEALFDLDIQIKLKEIRTIYPDFELFPASAQEGVFDMAYNLGARRMTRLFPNFHAAVTRHDWAGAAKRCNRYQLSKERNDATKKRFNDAAELVKKQSATWHSRPRCSRFLDPY